MTCLNRYDIKLVNSNFKIVFKITAVINSHNNNNLSDSNNKTEIETDINKIGSNKFGVMATCCFSFLDWIGLH